MPVALAKHGPKWSGDARERGKPWVFRVRTAAMVYYTQACDVHGAKRDGES